MRFEDERYVRVYTRDTTEWVCLSWEARALFLELLRKVDRAGILDMGAKGPAGLAALIRYPADVVARALEELASDGCLVVSGTSVVVPKFLRAQEAKQSDAARKRDQRERDRVAAVTAGHATGQSVTHRDAESRTVTEGHTESHAVTDGHAESRSVTPSLAVPNLGVPPLVPPGPPVAVPATDAPAAPKAKRAPVVTSMPAEPYVLAWLERLGVPSPTDAEWGAEVLQWLDHHRARASKFADWAAAWRTWRRNSAKFARSSPRSGVALVPRQQGLHEAPRDLVTGLPWGDP